MSNEKLWTFELSADGDRLDIHCDRTGLQEMIESLRKLASTKTLPDHDHWMAPSWAGDELTEKPQASDSKLIRHVKIHLWR
jgi:hypothetical protein